MRPDSTTAERRRRAKLFGGLDKSAASSVGLKGKFILSRKMGAFLSPDWARLWLAPAPAFSLSSSGRGV
jgi:hypothetical protein